MELDHVFVCTDVGAPGAEALTALGFREGEPNKHPGQGTACRRFFFGNGYLELIWVDDEGAAARTAPWLLERWRRRHDGGCPFGVAFRPSVDGESAAFATTAYRAPYLPEGLSIGLATDASAGRPLYFYMDFVKWRNTGDMEITGVEVGGPQQGTGFGTVAEIQLPHHLLTVTLDENICGQAADLRPQLPLIMQW
jgi:hypothetical protein